MPRKLDRFIINTLIFIFVKWPNFSKKFVDEIKVSAKSGKNIDFVFTLMAEALFLVNNSMKTKELVNFSSMFNLFYKCI
jgi:hypothetical protein